MKFLIATILMSSFVYAAPVKKAEPSKKPETAQKSQGNKALEVINKKAEDCDDKAKKPVEITTESISLGGTAGCSLDEAH